MREIPPTPKPRSLPKPAAEALAPELGRAFLLARRALGDSALAEDAVQEALLRLAEHPPRDLGGKALAVYFLRAVHGVAVDLTRAETARRAREEKAAVNARPPAARPDQAAAAREAALAARRALDQLSPDVRTAVCLCCEEGFTQSEAAEILGVPMGTVARRVQRGLEDLRERMTRAGFVVSAPAALAGLLGVLEIPAAPAGLVTYLNGLVHGTAPAATGGASGAAAAAKGGLIVKIGLGVAAASLVAGGVFWAVGGKSEEDVKPPEPKSKFAIPCWDPEARWAQDPEPFMGSGALGYLDGPRREVMWHIIGAADASPLFNSDESYPYGFFSYDSATERVHVTAGGATQRGYLDGPIARARFGGFDYSHRGAACGSPDGRYLFFVEPYLKGTLRRLDLEKQEVKTIYRDIPWEKLPRGMTCDSKGRLYMFLESGLQITDPDGKVEKTLALKREEGPIFNWSLALDEVHNRLYSSGGVKKKWYVWYWDLADGSFHGVLPYPQQGEGRPDAVAMYPSAGPFKGTVLYAEMGCGFGPDDPEKNFLYLYPNDTNTIVRLDLKKEQVWLFSGEKEARWISTGKPKNIGPWGHMDAEFNIVGYRPPWEGSQVTRFKRVK